uniref:Secreted protein n=1 Tax=Timema poppense TaxID=170557 RepID=A0A7R9H1E5_TIMPO|nr:unnamed protein product [Timema poppensis]
MFISLLVLLTRSKCGVDSEYLITRCQPISELLFLQGPWQHLIYGGAGDRFCSLELLTLNESVHTGEWPWYHLTSSNHAQYQLAVCSPSIRRPTGIHVETVAEVRHDTGRKPFQYALSFLRLD